MRQATRGWIRTAVIATLGAFALVTMGVSLPPIVAGNSFDRLDPYATTDAFLRILDVPHPGMLVEGGLRRYGPDKTLLFVSPAKEVFSAQVYYAVSHLAYPRPIPAILCGEPGKTSSTAVEKVPGSAPIDGLIFFETDPGPWVAGGTRITPNLYIAPHSGAASWESFCR